MKLNPKHNHVVVKQQSKEEETVGNIIVPDMGKDLPLIGEVIAVGVGTYTINGELIPIQAKVGEKVAFPSFGGTKFTIKGEEFVVLKDQDILTAIID